MGWCRNYWDYGASSVAIDSSGWKVLLVSLHFSRRGDAASLFIFSVSLRTWISPLGIHECLRHNQTWLIAVVLGCVSFIIRSWLSVNSLPSPGNDYSDGRWPMANVGVHSYISTKAGPTSSLSDWEFLYFVVLWLCKNCFFLTCAGWHLLLLYSMTLFSQGASDLEEASPLISCQWLGFFCLLTWSEITAKENMYGMYF